MPVTLTVTTRAAQLNSLTKSLTLATLLVSSINWQLSKGNLRKKNSNILTTTAMRSHTNTHVRKRKYRAQSSSSRPDGQRRRFV